MKLVFAFCSTENPSLGTLRFLSPARMETRKSWEIPVLNVPTLDVLGGSKLPTKIEVFRHCLYLHKVKELKLGTAKTQAVQAVCKVWNKVGVGTKKVQHGVEDLNRIHEEFKQYMYL